MIPVSIELAGFLSYRDPVEIDFTGFDLACISGQNGAGKSSILDAMTWALFGRARKHDESVINLASETAQVAFIFKYESNLYRVVRTNPRGKTSAVEFHLHEGGNGSWRPLTESSLRETDQKIADILRLDYETFINAAFFLQGDADQFTQHNPSERKRILSQILNLGIWEDFRKMTFQKRRDCESEITRVEGRASEIRSELSEEDQRRWQLDVLEKDLAESEKARTNMEQELIEMEQYHQSIADQAQITEDLDQQVEGKQLKLEKLREKLIPRTKEQESFYEVMDAEVQIEKDFSEWEEDKRNLAVLDQTAQKFLAEERERQKPLAEITSEKARLEQELENLEAEKAAVENSSTRITSMEEFLEELAAETVEVEEKIEVLEQKRKQLEQAQQNLADARAENPILFEEMKKLEKRIQELDEAGGVDCPLCGQPMPKKERKELVSELKAQGKEMGDRYRENKQILSGAEDQVHSLKEEIKVFAAVNKKLRTLSTEQEKLNLEITRLTSQKEEWAKKGKKRLKEIQKHLEDKTFAPEAHKALAKIDKELKSIGYDPAEHDRTRKKVEEGKTCQAEMQELEKAKAALAPLERDIADITDAIKSERKELDELSQTLKGSIGMLEDLKTHSPDLKKAKKDLLSLKEQENILQREVGAAQQKVSVLKTQKERLDALDQELSSFREKIRLHKQLEEAFGKNGVPALLIEQALPMIELKANEILGRLSNGAMSIQFITQREYKDKTRTDLKETLDIQIQDRAGIRDYEMFSGGESFRINFAIRLALSHVLAQRAGARLQTLVIDEGFGSQDEIGRQRLTEAITLVKDDYKKILVITHIDALKDTFSTQLVVEKTPTGSVVSVQ
jgi:exonuclease SbcC